MQCNYIALILSPILGVDLFNHSMLLESSIGIYENFFYNPNDVLIQCQVILFAKSYWQSSSPSQPYMPSLIFSSSAESRQIYLFPDYNSFIWRHESHNQR